MPRLTRDEAFRLQDRFEEFIHGQIGQDYTFHLSPNRFDLEVLRTKSRSLPEAVTVSPRATITP